jgi:hypothetical protein
MRFHSRLKQTVLIQLKSFTSSYTFLIPSGSEMEAFQLRVQPGDIH